MMPFTVLFDSLLQFNDGNTTFTFPEVAQAEGFDGFVLSEHLVDSCAERTGALAVNDGDRRELCHNGAVNILLGNSNCLDGLHAAVEKVIELIK